MRRSLRRDWCHALFDPVRPRPRRRPYHPGRYVAACERLETRSLLSATVVGLTAAPGGDDAYGVPGYATGRITEDAEPAAAYTLEADLNGDGVADDSATYSPDPAEVGGDGAGFAYRLPGYLRSGTVAFRVGDSAGGGGYGSAGSWSDWSSLPYDLGLPPNEAPTLVWAGLEGESGGSGYGGDEGYGYSFYGTLRLQVKDFTRDASSYELQLDPEGDGVYDPAYDLTTTPGGDWAVPIVLYNGETSLAFKIIETDYFGRTFVVLGSVAPGAPAGAANVAPSFGSANVPAFKIGRGMSAGTSIGTYVATDANDPDPKYALSDPGWYSESLGGGFLKAVPRKAFSVTQDGEVQIADFGALQGLLARNPYLSYTVTADDGQRTASLTGQVYDHAPTGGSESGFGLAGNPIEVEHVLMNDTDPDPGETNDLTVGRVIQPKHGSVAYDAQADAFTYVSNPLDTTWDGYGTDTFVYYVTDGVLETAVTASVGVNALRIFRAGEDVTNLTRSSVVGKGIYLITALEGPGFGDQPTPFLEDIQWSVPGEIVKSYEIDFNYAKARNLEPEDYAQSFIHYYWVKEVSGSVSVTAAALGLELHASVRNFSVFGPTGMNVTSTYGAVSQRTIGPQEVLSLGPGPNAQEGIVAAATATAPAGLGGDFAVIQLVNTVRHRTPQNGVRETFTNGDKKYSLDRAYISKGVVTQEVFISGPPVPVAAGAPAEMTFVDTPSQGINSSGLSVDVNDNFADYLMFKPEGPDSIWVPTWKFRWGWDAEANSTGGIWAVGPALPVLDPTLQGPTVEFPEWTSRIQDLLNYPGFVEDT